MRSPASMDIVQLDITNKCHLRCSNCTRLVAHQEVPFEMDLYTFARAVQSMAGWYQPGRVLGVMGGEPTLHSQFEEIARILQDLWNRSVVHPHGKQPIRDFNAYVQERLQDRTSGRGLWTSLGPGYYKHYEIIQEVFDHQTVNTHEHPGVHQALLITRKELGIPDEEWIPLRDKCWVQNMWSASITPHGAYFCEVAGALDNLLYKGAHAWPIREGWWRRTPDQFGDQLKLCEHCALALPVPAVEARKNRDLISPDSLRLLKEAHSPAVEKGKFDLFSPELEQEPREVTTIDSYLSEEKTRVAPDHKSILPRSVTGVVVCVGCADQLQATLNFNLTQLEHIVVVTTSDDADTKRVVAQEPRARLVVSDRCYEEDCAFNKGRLLNDGLKSIDNPDWILLTDADILLNPHTKIFLARHAFNPGCLYGTLRDEEPPWESPAPEGVNAEPNGYFQLWHPRAQALRSLYKGTPAVMSEEFCSAGGVDSWFLQQFPADKRIILPEVRVSHFGHGAFGGRWNGTKKRRGWHQVGMLTPSHLIWTHAQEVIPPGAQVRLTDTVYGKTTLATLDAAGNLPANVLMRDPHEGFVFLGQGIGHAHIQVAVWREKEDRT